MRHLRQQSTVDGQSCLYTLCQVLLTTSHLYLEGQAAIDWVPALSMPIRLYHQSSRDVVLSIY